jgi:hypothetical protein
MPKFKKSEMELQAVTIYAAGFIGAVSGPKSTKFLSTTKGGIN